ncbi:MAG: ImmA/IrrE family metallo-endopeptidase [Clostridiaceae bacterium]
MPTLEELFSFGAAMIKVGELSVKQNYIEANGFVKRKNNQYLIVINDQLSDEKKVKTLIHELVHVYMGHNHLTPVQDETITEHLTESIWEGGKCYERAHKFLQAEEW